MSGLSQRDKQDILDAVVKSRPSKLQTTATALIAGIVGGGLSLVAEQIIGDTKDTLGWNMSLIEAEVGITRSTEEGRYIFAGGSSLTPYNLLLNTLAEELDKDGFGGYGYAAPGGSTINLQGVNSRSYPMALAIAQADVYARMRNDGELDDTSIIMNTGIPECAFTVGNYLTFSELAEAAQQAAWNEDGQKIVIGMPNSNSGSHITAENIVEYGLDPNGIEIRDGYVDTGVLLDAYESGDIDVAIFVQYPAAIEGELRSGMKRVIDDEFNLVAMDTMSYNYSFRDLPYGYNLLQVTMPRSPNANNNATRRTTNASTGDVDPSLANLRISKPMLCTEVLLAAQKIPTISDIIDRGNARNLHGAIQQKIRPRDLQFRDMPNFQVLESSSQPIEISYEIEASLPRRHNDQGLQPEWMKALRQEEFIMDEPTIDHALVEDLNYQPHFG